MSKSSGKTSADGAERFRAVQSEDTCSSSLQVPI